MLGATQIKVLSGVDTGDVTGAAIYVAQAVALSFVPKCGDTGVSGTVKVQCSNDVPNGPLSQFLPSNWADIPNATSAIAAGVGPAIVLPNACFGWIRVIFTHSAGGSSTIQVFMSRLDM